MVLRAPTALFLPEVCEGGLSLLEFPLALGPFLLKLSTAWEVYIILGALATFSPRNTTGTQVGLN